MAISWLVPEDKIIVEQIGKEATMLDSGAFTAYSLGTKITIEDYMQYVLKYKSKIDFYHNLDVIGDPKATLENQLTMEKNGFAPIPCFHVGDDFKYLKRYCKNYDYIALGGMVPYRKAVKKSTILEKWLAQSFEIIQPENKVHGFGLSLDTTSAQYPWFSFDNTSMDRARSMSKLFLPKRVWINGKYYYDFQNRITLLPGSRKTTTTFFGTVRNREIIKGYVDTISKKLELDSNEFIHNIFNVTQENIGDAKDGKNIEGKKLYRSVSKYLYFINSVFFLNQEKLFFGDSGGMYFAGQVLFRDSYLKKIFIDDKHFKSFKSMVKRLLGSFAFDDFKEK